MELSWAQTMTKELIKHLKQINEDLDKGGTAFAEAFNKMSEEHKRLSSDIRSSYLDLMIRVGEGSSSPLLDFINRHRKQRTPPVPTERGLGHPPTPPTFGEVIYALDKIAADRGFEKMQKAIMEKPLAELQREYEGLYGLGCIFKEETRKRTFKEWASDLKSSAKEFLTKFKKFSTWMKIAKGIMYGVGVGMLALGMINNHKVMDNVTIWMNSLELGIVAAGVLVGRLGRWVLTKVYAAWDWGRKATGRVVAWLTNTVVEKGISLGKRFVHAFAGSLYKCLRLVGLACTVLEIIQTRNDLEKEKEMNEKDKGIYEIFNRIQFWLGVFEAVMIVAQIGFEILAMTTAASLCGALGAFAGVAGIIVMLVYLYAFAPDPWDFAKKWLESEGKDLGSYDPNVSVGAESEPSIPLPSKS